MHSLTFMKCTFGVGHSKVHFLKVKLCTFLLLACGTTVAQGYAPPIRGTEISQALSV